MNIFIFERNWQATAAALDDISIYEFLTDAVGRMGVEENKQWYAIAAQWFAAEFYRRMGMPYAREKDIWDVLAAIGTTPSSIIICTEEGDTVYFQHSQMQRYWDSRPVMPLWSNRRPPDWYDGGGWGL